MVNPHWRLFQRHLNVECYVYDFISCFLSILNLTSPFRSVSASCIRPYFLPIILCNKTWTCIDWLNFLWWIQFFPFCHCGHVPETLAGGLDSTPAHGYLTAWLTTFNKTQSTYSMPGAMTFKLLTVYQRRYHKNKYCQFCAITGVFRPTSSPEELVITYDRVGAREGQGKLHKTDAWTGFWRLSRNFLGIEKAFKAEKTSSYQCINARTNGVIVRKLQVDVGFLYGDWWEMWLER